MPIVVLHKNARTTHAIRKEIKEGLLSYKKIAESYKVSLDTVAKWKTAIMLKISLIEGIILMHL